MTKAPDFLSCFLWFWLMAGCLALSGILPIQAQAAPTVRVALQDFSPAGTSYWAGREAAGFTAAVQALLPSEEAVEWVDRAEVELAVRELALSQWAAPDNASRLRLGHWLGADFILVGGFSSEARKRERQLTLEVIEVRRADVIAERVVVVDGGGDLSSYSTNDLERAVEAVRSLLEEAREIVAADAGRPVVAPIAFLNTDVSRRLDEWERKIGTLWRDRARANGTVRVLNLGRPRDADAERRLSLLGLVAGGEEDWRKVADVYVWGEFQEVEYADRPFEDVVVEFQIHIWAGEGDMATVVKRGRVGDFERLAVELADEVFSQAQGARAVTGEAARRAAEKLDAQRHRIQARSASRPGRQQVPAQQEALREYSQTLLEIAYFLDSSNVERSWELAQSRDSGERFASSLRRAEEMIDWCWRNRDTADQRMFSARLNNTLRAWFALPALLNHDRLRSSGLPSDLPPNVLAQQRAEIEERIVREVEYWRGEVVDSSGSHFFLSQALSSALTMQDVQLQLRMVELLENRFRRMETEVRQEVANEHPFQRAHHERRAAEMSVNILRVFLNAGKLEEGIAWLNIDLSERPAERPVSRDRAGSPNSPPGVAASAPPVEAGLVEQLPVPDPDRPSLPWEEWQVPERPTLIFNGLETRPLSLSGRRPLVGAVRPQGARSHREQLLEVQRVAASDRHVWLAGSLRSADGQMDFIGRMGRRFSHHLPEPILMRFDRTKDSIEEIESPPGMTSAVSDMVEFGGYLWLATESEGVYRMDGSGEWRNYRARDGVVSDEIRQLIPAGDRLLVIGERAITRLVGAYDLVSDQWIRLDLAGDQLRALSFAALSGDWLLIRSSSLHLLHLPTRRMIDLRRTLERSFGDHPLRLHVAAADDGFWMVTQNGTFFLNPDQPRRLEKIHSFTGHVTALKAHGKGLWIAGASPQTRQATSAQTQTFEGYLVLIHREMPHWVGALPVPGHPTSIDVSASSLWLSLDSPVGPVWEFGIPKSIQNLLMGGADSFFQRAFPEDSPLTGAARTGDVAQVARLLDDGHSANEVTESGITPLLAAVVADQPEVVSLLLARGAEVDRGRGKTPLRIAAELDLLEAGQILLAGGAAVNRAGADGLTPLHAAARSGAAEFVALLCEKGAQPDVRDQEGWTPLHYAALHRHTFAAAALLENGADVNQAAAPRSILPIQLALMAGGEETALLLLAHGANAVGQGMLVERAARSGMQRALRGLLERGAPVIASRGTQPFDHVISIRDDEMVQAFFDYGWDPTLVREGRPVGARALRTAVRVGNEKLVDDLLGRGLDPNLLGDALSSPLAEAVRGEKPTIVRRLLEAGADPSGTDGNGRPLVEQARSEEIRALLRRFQQAAHGETAAERQLEPASFRPAHQQQDPPSVLDFLLAEGLRHGYDEIAMQALRAGASPDATARGGWPVLAIAASRNQLTLAEELLARGADVNARQRGYGPAALHQAAVRNLPEMAALLGKHGADIGMRRHSRDDALSIAESRGHREVVRVLRELPDRSASSNELTRAIDEQSLQEIQRVARGMGNVNTPDMDFRRPLTLALAERIGPRLEVVRVLIEAGADVNLPDPRTGMPPLLLAIGAGAEAPDLVRLLLSRGANPAVVDREGRGVAHYLGAARSGVAGAELERIFVEVFGSGSMEGGGDAGRN